MFHTMWLPSPQNEQGEFLQESQIWDTVEASASVGNTQPFTRCPVCDNECVAISDAMVTPDVSCGSLGAAGLINNSLIRVDLIGERAFTMSFYTSDPGCLIGRYTLFSWFMAPNRDVFNLPVLVFQLARPLVTVQKSVGILESIV